MTVSDELLDEVRYACGITDIDTKLDREITALINAAVADLSNVGITAEAKITDPAIIQAVKTYAKMKLGNPPNYERLLAAYEEAKGSLMKTTGYTVWG